MAGTGKSESPVWSSATSASVSRSLASRIPTSCSTSFPGLWAYSTLQWLRHTIPTDDTNRGRWECSPFWQAIQQADFFGNGTPAVRERKRAGDLRLICQMLAGCSTTAAAYLAGQLPADEDGTHFLLWFMTWQEEYLRKKRVSFGAIRDFKQTQLGVFQLRLRPRKGEAWKQ